MRGLFTFAMVSNDTFILINFILLLPTKGSELFSRISFSDGLDGLLVIFHQVQWAITVLCAALAHWSLSGA